MFTFIRIKKVAIMINKSFFSFLFSLTDIPLLFMRKDGELPVLPLSVYGAVAMAHSENSDEYSSPYQFFFYLYDKRSVSQSNILINLIM